MSENDKNDLIGTPEVAKILNVSVRRVQAMIKQGILHSKQDAREHLLERAEVEAVRIKRESRKQKS